MAAFYKYFNGNRVVISLFILLLSMNPSRSADQLSTSRRTAIVRAVEQIQPAVVSVYVTFTERVRRPYWERDPFWGFFYPRSYLVPLERTSSGSGLIVDNKGHILTNDHLIGSKRQLQHIEISLQDGRSFAADYIGSDTSFDLALIKTQGDNLPVAPLGNSDDILVGEWAIAIGNPFDVGVSVSAGIISGINRDFPQAHGDYFYRDMIQTDASINPGNSGGPLINALGEVIGINSFIHTGSDYNIGSIGIGFAIPSNIARSFLDEITRHGKVRRPWTGILRLQNITPRLAEGLDLPSTNGALIVDLTDAGPAYKAGLRRWDTLIAVNNDDIVTAQQARSILQGFRVDEQCTLTVARDGETLDLMLILSQEPQRSGRGY